MDWTVLITTFLGLILGGGGSLLYFRPKLKEAKVGAEKAKADFLEERINAMGELYKSQGAALDDVRRQVLVLSRELQDKNQRILQLETENKQLTEKVAALEDKLNNYKLKSK